MRISKKEDVRMQWILKLEELEQTEEEFVYFTDFEICSEVRIPGVFVYGDNMFLRCALFQEADSNGLYTYILRVRHSEKIFEYNEDDYSKDGYYFQEGLIGEIIALFSVYFQTRFYLKAQIIGKETQTSIRMRIEKGFQYRKVNSNLNSEMFTDQGRNWCKDNGLKFFLDSIRKLDQKYHQNLIRSFHWYTEAIKEIGIDHQLFFIKMVSSVEALLNFFRINEDRLEEKLSKLQKKHFFEKNEYVEIINWLANRKIRRRFADFFEKYSDNFFKNTEEVNSLYINKREVRKYVNQIYNARSAYLHEGKPMFLSMDLQGGGAINWDFDPSLGMLVDRKKFSIKEKLPRVRWFERITNHCLKNFIKNKL